MTEQSAAYKPILPPSACEPGEHYGYCRDDECPGCLTSDETLQRWADDGFMLDLWAEMLRRCIAQRPEAKTAEGALAILRERREWYLTAARQAREASVR